MKLRSDLSRSETVERISMLLRVGVLLAPCIALMSFSAFAADLNGAWATDAAVCSKVSVKNGDRVSFTSDADLYGGGFIVEENRASGTFQKCKIKSMKTSGTTVHLIAACSDGIMVQDAQITVKLVGPDKITLVFEGVESEENPYVRCRP
jgi:hypothetical protein